ncbi:hypothetical protein [Nonomuraea guangzhouensis]|uniref:Uncharacterized protein n=1 Tax=Nonomuraea guangzhouensis TaxID=1291555 RepID=A0ABW4GBB7_9ACTN|nr:hypothetical protein [Nonomuraea guangzhouensis]
MILDRRPALALAAGGLMLAGVAVALIARPFWHPMLTPHVLGGAIIGVDVVVIPAVLGRISRALRMTWGLAAVGGGGALALVVLLAHLSRSGAYLIEEASDAGFLGMLGGFVAGGGMVLVGTAVLLLRETDVKHIGWAEERAGGGEGYVAVCACGWRGSARQDASQALTEAGDHAGTVRPMVRRT